jgi:hypothetical protein
LERTYERRGRRNVTAVSLAWLAAASLAFVFLTLDYFVRPSIMAGLGDNGTYALVVLLGIEFATTWRMFGAIASSGGH